MIVEQVLIVILVIVLANVVIHVIRLKRDLKDIIKGRAMSDNFRDDRIRSINSEQMKMQDGLRKLGLEYKNGTPSHWAKTADKTNS